MLIDALNKMWEHKEKKNCDKVFIALDIHDVIGRGNYKANELPTEFLRGARETIHTNVI